MNNPEKLDPSLTGVSSGRKASFVGSNPTLRTKLFPKVIIKNKKFYNSSIYLRVGNLQW
jgi:hypothetical protein